MKYRWSFLMFLLAFMLQGNILNLFSVFGVTANLILCLTVALAFLYDSDYHAVIFGTLFGLFADMCFSTVVGVSALGYFLIALLVMALSNLINKEQVLSIIILSVLTTVLFQGYMFVFSSILGGNETLMFYLGKLPLQIALNLIVSCIFYAIFIRKIYKSKRDKFYYGRHIYR